MAEFVTYRDQAGKDAGPAMPAHLPRKSRDKVAATTAIAKELHLAGRLYMLQMKRYRSALCGRSEWILR